MFLATKLFLPLLPTGAIQRDRLFNALNDSWDSSTRLILLSAPPGYGKTTLLSGWVQARQLPCAWLSLDPADNDPARFFILLLRALEPHLPALTGLLPVLQLPQATDYDNLIAEIINHAVRLQQPLLLVLDDYHAITDSRVHSLVQFLLNYLPPQLRLAVLTREDPPFNLAQMRVRRQMLELRAKELTFSAGEGRALLVDALNLALDEAQLLTLLERTEGWAAGLQLAALTLRDHAQPAQLIAAFGGSHRFVLDYLMAEVLDRLPPELRSFLCRSALLGRFNASLCDAALAIEGSAGLIAAAAAANLFLIGLDDQREWYRYHHLMAEILRAEVPLDERQAIQRRAAQWLQAHQQPFEAVQAALEAEDYALAASFIRAAAIPAAEAGLLSMALGWLEALPRETLLAAPDLCIFRAWFLIFNGQFHEVQAWMRELSGLPLDLPRPLLGLLDGMQAWMGSVSGQPVDLARIQSAYDMQAGQYPYFSPMMLLAVGQAQQGAGDLPGALASFERGAAQAERSSGPISALILRNNQAFLLDATGQRQRARQLCQDGIERFPGLLAGIPMLPYGCFQYDSGELDEAYHHLTQSVNLIRRMGLYHVLCAPANNVLQQLLADQGRLEEALALNRQVKREAQKAGLRVVEINADLVAAWLHLQAGRIEPAAAWVRANPLVNGRSPHPNAAVAITLHARLLAADGQARQALDLLKPLCGQNHQAGLRTAWVRHTLELALAYLADGDLAQAETALLPALQAAAEMDYCQVFRRSAAALSPLLTARGALRGRFPAIWSREASGSAAPPAASAKPAPALVEPPGQRELEILRLVSAGSSNAEIADRLYITVGTVKWHLNQLYGKLGVNRRTEAVARARSLGLL